jgi:hypothetical protein
MDAVTPMPRLRMMQMLRIDPFVIINGIIRGNSLVPPDELFERDSQPGRSAKIELCPR